MPNKNFLRGYRFEKRVQKFWEARGFFVIRQGASKFPDLIIVSKDGSYFIECKNHKKIPSDKTKLLSQEEYNHACELVNKYHLPFLLFWNEDRQIHAIAIGGKGEDFLFNWEL